MTQDKLFSNPEQKHFKTSSFIIFQKVFFLFFCKSAATLGANRTGTWSFGTLSQTPNQPNRTNSSKRFSTKHPRTIQRETPTHFIDIDL